MAAPFSRSLRSLEADTFRRPAGGLTAGAALLAAWLAWLFLARVAVYEISDAARLELDQAVHEVGAFADGRVVASYLRLGQDVVAGQVLLELDSTSQRLQLDEQTARLEALGSRLEPLRNEIASEKQAIHQAGQASLVALDEARAALDEADAVARIAEEEAARSSRLHATGLVSEVELLRMKATAQERRAAAERFRLAIQRLEREQWTSETDRRTRISKLAGEVAAVEGEMKTSASTIHRLEEKAERRRVRAPTAGRLSDVARLEAGAVVREGQKLATIVSAGTLKVVADFLPSDALGRVREGQTARLRLEGFPWTQYGSVPAKVVTVAGELRVARVRVELSLDSGASTTIPLQHGLPGSVEVEVERISPAALVLRAAGRLLAASALSGRTDAESGHSP